MLKIFTFSQLLAIQGGEEAAAELLNDRVQPRRIPFSQTRELEDRYRYYLSPTVSLFFFKVSTRLRVGKTIT